MKNKPAVTLVTYFFVFLLSLTPCRSYSQELNAVDITVIDSLVSTFMQAYAITGLSIGIVRYDESNTFHYGHTNLDRKFPVTDSTMFHLASVSKLFTATAIMQLVEKNELDLDARLVSVIPEFHMKDKRAELITIRHLLTHTSGLMWDNTLRHSPDNRNAIPLFLEQLKRKKLNFSPGTELSYKTYSNVAFDLLGMVIERISGSGYDAYVEKEILRPMRMNRSTYAVEGIDTMYLALPVICAGPPGKVNRINLTGLDSADLKLFAENKLTLKAFGTYGEDYEHNASGNLISSAVELNKWMQSLIALYADTVYTGILQRATQEEMWTIQKEIAGKRTSIGLGWWIYQDEKLGKSVFHVGNNPGFCTILMIFPEHKLGITILCNASYAQEGVWNKLTTKITGFLIIK